MSKQTASSLFIDSSMRRFYQQLFAGIANYKELGNRITLEVKTAHAFRDVRRVQELSKILINIPIKEYQLIGQYYLVWCKCRSFQYDADILETIAEQTQTYKTQVLLSRGTFEACQGKAEPALYFYSEALKASRTGSDYVGSSLAIAVVKSIEGFHKSALMDLEKLLPIIKHAEPRLYFDFLNSYAVELGEAGSALEARNVSRLVLASPFIHAYPEWQETAQELKEPNRAFISVPLIKHEPVRVEKPKPQHASKEPKANQSGKLIYFPPPKEAPEPEKPELVNSQEFASMTLADKREFLLAALRTELLLESEYNKMMLMLGLVKTGPGDHVIDLEDETVLDNLMVEWAHLVEPDQMAAVISALRDCEDNERQTAIMDNMITKLFDYSRRRNITEAEWRLEVEHRLPKK